MQKCIQCQAKMHNLCKKGFLLNTIGYRFGQALDAIYGASSTKKCVSDLGVSQSTIDRGKNGDSLTKTISIFAAKKGVSTSWLLTGEGEMLVSSASSQHQTMVGNHGNMAGRDNNAGSRETSSGDPITAAIISLISELGENEKVQVLSYVTSLKMKTDK